ncbi:MAG TPA: SIMPL domain-containing protein [Terriglobales bacterium]|nr:SIMPL domain-containing protein [Terriglobales bacterium]
MKNARFALVVILLTAAASFSQNAPTPVATQNTIYVGADGKFEAAPDTAVIQFGISAQEDSSQAAYAHASRSADQVRDLLRKNGTDPKAAQVGFFSLDPVYDYRNPKRKLVGYRCNTNVTLKMKDFSKVGPILQGLADLDITENQSLSYDLDNMDEAKTKAAQDALQRARGEAAAVANAAQRGLGELVYASVDVYENRPVPLRAMPMAAKAGAATPEPTAEFSAQNITVNAHVNAMFALK